MAAVARVAAADGIGTRGSDRRAVLAAGSAAGVVVVFLSVSFLDGVTAALNQPGIGRVDR
jgi:hypothetical protein